MVLNTCFILIEGMREDFEPFRRDTESILETGEEEERKRNFMFFFGSAIGLNPFNPAQVEKNKELVKKLEKLSEFASKVVDDKNVNPVQGGVELHFKNGLVEPSKVIKNFEKHNWNYNSTSSGSLHFFSKRDKNLLMYSLKKPDKLTVITGNHSKEDLLDGLTEFFSNFSWKKPGEHNPWA